MTDGKRNIIRQLLQEYDIQIAEDIQKAQKDLLVGTIKEMMEAGMEEHPGYGRSEHSDNEDSRNGYKKGFRLHSSISTTSRTYVLNQICSESYLLLSIL